MVIFIPNMKSQITQIIKAYFINKLTDYLILNKNKNNYSYKWISLELKYNLKPRKEFELNTFISSLLAIFMNLITSELFK